MAIFSLYLCVSLPDESLWYNTSERGKVNLWSVKNKLEITADLGCWFRDLQILLESFFFFFQLSYASSEAPGKIESAVQEAESTTTLISEFSSDKDCLSGDISNHQVDVMNLVKDISSLTDQIRELQYYTKYMQVIGKIEDLRYLETLKQPMQREFLF